VEETVSCESPGDGSLTCTGSGAMLVDCVATNDLFDLTTGLALNVEMAAPSDDQDFSLCSNVELLGQGFFLGILCPDESITFDNIACFPISSYTVAENNPLCLAQCNGDCTDASDIPNIRGEVLAPGSCLWEPEDLGPTSTMPSPPMTTSPTAAPISATMTPVPLNQSTSAPVTQPTAPISLPTTTSVPVTQPTAPVSVPTTSPVTLTTSPSLQLQTTPVMTSAVEKGGFCKKQAWLLVAATMTFFVGMV